STSLRSSLISWSRSGCGAMGLAPGPLAGTESDGFWRGASLLATGRNISSPSKPRVEGLRYQVRTCIACSFDRNGLATKCSLCAGRHNFPMVMGHLLRTGRCGQNRDLWHPKGWQRKAVCEPTADRSAKKSDEPTTHRSVGRS